MKVIKELIDKSILDEDLIRLTGCDVKFYLIPGFERVVSICIGDTWYANQSLTPKQIEDLAQELEAIGCVVYTDPILTPPPYKFDLPREDYSEYTIDDLIERVNYLKALATNKANYQLYPQ